MRSKLEEVATRQKNNSRRDVAFGAFMALVIAFMLVAFTATNRTIEIPATHAADAAQLVNVADQIERHTAQVCGDLDAPEPPPVAEPMC